MNRLLVFLLLAGPALGGALEDRLVRMVEDPDPRVRFQLALTLGELPSSEAKVNALARIALQDSSDRWARTAILSSAREDSVPLFQALSAALGQSEPPEGIPEFLRELARVIGARKLPEEIARTLSAVVNLDSDKNKEGKSAALAGLSAGLDLAGGEVIPVPGAGESLSRLLADPLAEVRDSAIRIAGRIQSAETQTSTESLERDLATARNEEKPEVERIESIQRLRLADISKTQSTLEGLLSALQPEAVELAALEVLVETAGVSATEILLAHWRELSPKAKEAALREFFARRERLVRLLAAIEQGDIPASVVDAPRQNQLANYPDPEVVNASKRLFGQPDKSEDPAIYERFRSALELQGDPSRGAAIHKERCAQCHKVGEVGFQLGPDWAAVKSNPPDSLLVSILYPNRVVAPGYTQYVVETVDGEVLSGILAVSGPTSLIIRAAGGEDTTVLRQNIAEIRDTSLSLMPAKLEEGLTPRDMADLLAFMRE